MRVAWVHIDGTGAPEFLTSDQEVAHGARLSPDNRRILCQIGSQSPKNEASRARLNVIDLATKQRTVIDKLGYTDSYCWSSDGSKVAYTWQLPLREPGQNEERKTYHWNKLRFFMPFLEPQVLLQAVSQQFSSLFSSWPVCVSPFECRTRSAEAWLEALVLNRIRYSRFPA